MYSVSLIIQNYVCVDLQSKDSTGLLWLNPISTEFLRTARICLEFCTLLLTGLGTDEGQILNLGKQVLTCSWIYSRDDFIFIWLSSNCDVLNMGCLEQVWLDMPLDIPVFMLCRLIHKSTRTMCMQATFLKRLLQSVKNTIVVWPMRSFCITFKSEEWQTPLKTVWAVIGLPMASQCPSFTCFLLQKQMNTRDCKKMFKIQHLTVLCSSTISS